MTYKLINNYKNNYTDAEIKLIINNKLLKIIYIMQNIEGG